MFVYRDAVAHVLEDAIAGGEIAGANVYVFKDGKERFFGSYGEADMEQGVPMKRDTIFRLYSLSKPITAAAVMILYERGDLDIWEPVSKYIPAFHNPKVVAENGSIIDARREITIWDCLNMKIGLPYPSDDHETGKRLWDVFRRMYEKNDQGNRPDTMEYVEEFAKVPMLFHPGEMWCYGVAADILGAVVQVVSGKRYGQFLQDEIFGPLGMKDTGFFVPEEKWHRFAVGYDWNGETGKLEPFTRSQLGEYYKKEVAFESGGAGMVSTIDDYSKFAQMLLNKGKLGEVRLLGEKTVELMSENQIKEHQRKYFNWDSIAGYGYGCLMRNLRDKGVAGTNGSVGEFGWDGWMGAYMTVNPADQTVILFFIQRCGYGCGALTRKIRAMTYGALQDL